MDRTIATRFLIISDTHSLDFGDVEKYDGLFKPPFPKSDVVLHCGDLTAFGDIRELKNFVEMMGKFDAELKLVIAGNHDLNLDPHYWKGHMAENYTEEEHKEAVEVMTGPLAQAAGMTYLEEGINTFTLKNGAKFSIYTSPYTPEFCDWGFPYRRYEDRFSTLYQKDRASTSIAVNPIPDHGSVDIVMTHGPPQHILDECASGFVGCANLLQAVSRCRPRLHCFGHIHEGNGARKIMWHEDTTALGRLAIKGRTAQENTYPVAQRCEVEYGKETMIVNAAIMNLNSKPTQKPWLLDLNVPRA